MSNANSPEVTAFFEAVLHRQTSLVREMVRKNRALLDARDYRCFGATPITCIAFGGDSREMIQLLLDLGADIDAKSDWDMGPWSPLHCAIHSGNDDLAKWLLQRGATLDAHAAAALGMVDELKQLLDEDPEWVNTRGGDGCLPLHFAGTIATARLLVERGADVNARCVDHYSTPVQYCSHVRPEVARYLFTVGAESDIFTAVMADDLRLVASMIQAEPSLVNQRLTQDYFSPSQDHQTQNMLHFIVGTHGTPLHAAAKANRAQMVRLLTNLGGNVNARGGYDQAAPLHVAAWENAADAAVALVECGAEIDSRSGPIHNNSPAGWAIVAGSKDVFHHLMDHGASVFPWFIEDARMGAEGGFLKYKCVSLSAYEDILKRLSP